MKSALADFMNRPFGAEMRLKSWRSIDLKWYNAAVTFHLLSGQWAIHSLWASLSFFPVDAFARSRFSFRHLPQRSIQAGRLCAGLSLNGDQWGIWVF
jgi:hypothetical protein